MVGSRGSCSCYLSTGKIIDKDVYSDNMEKLVKTSSLFGTRTSLLQTMVMHAGEGWTNPVRKGSRGPIWTELALKGGQKSQMILKQCVEFNWIRGTETDPAGHTVVRGNLDASN